MRKGGPRYHPHKAIQLVRLSFPDSKANQALIMSDPIRRVPVEIDAQGQVKAQSVTSPIRFGVRAGVGVPPSKIIRSFRARDHGQQPENQSQQGQTVRDRLATAEWFGGCGNQAFRMEKRSPKLRTGAPRPGQHRD